MIKKITLYILLLFTIIDCYSQDYEDYNSFSSRNFMKFNSFLTVPTFSVLHRENQTIEAIVRSANIEFEDASRLHVLSYSGKMREQTGAGIAVFQQEIGVFKDFGASLNYAHQVQLGTKSSLALGFNLFYSRRGINPDVVITQAEDELVSNFQDIPIVNVQPAVTFSYGKFNLGVFFEDLAYFNLKSNALATGLAEKTVSAHVGYSTELNNASGLLNNTYIRMLALARRSQLNGFSYSGNLMIDLPKAGWLKAGYDNLYGFNAGIGINLSEKISIGFAYERKDVLGPTNEIGLLYNLGNKRREVIVERGNSKEPKVDVILPNIDKVKDSTAVKVKGSSTINIKENKDSTAIKVKDKNIQILEKNDLSGEIKRTQDSINELKKKLDEVLKLLKNQPKQVNLIKGGEVLDSITPTNVSKPTNTVSTRTAVTNIEPEEELDTTLIRRKDTPWREQTRTRSGGGGGTMYYVAVDQFKDVNKAKALVESYKRRKVKVKYVREPKTRAYFVYVNRHRKKEDAEKEKKEVNEGRGNGIDDDDDKANDLGIKSVYKDPVYVVKITFSAAGETYKEKKTQPKARVRTMKLVGDLEPGYYLRVNVYSKKSYADKFLDELRTDGINANYYIDPSTGYRHVYIFKTEDRAEALRLYNNNLNGSYYDPKSIINIR